MNNQEHTDEKKRRRWPWWILAVVIFLIGALRLSLMSGPVHNFVKNQVIEAANDQLTVPLHIGELRGDLWKEIKLYDISVQDGDEQAVSVDSLILRYDLLSYFDEEFVINEISIGNPFLGLQEKDGQWNVAGWLQPSEEDSTESATFPFAISKLTMLDGSVTVDGDLLPADSSFALRDIQLDGRLGIRPDGEFYAGIDTFVVSVVDTPLNNPVEINSTASADESSITLEQLVVATGHSLIESSGTFQQADSTAELSLTARPISWRDVSVFAEQVPVSEDITLSLNIASQGSDGTVLLNLDSKNIQNVRTSVDVQNWEDPTLSRLTVQADHINLASFLADTTMPELENLQFSAEGSLPISDIESARMEGEWSAEKLALQPYEIETFSGNFSWNQGDLQAQSNARNGRQQIALTARINQLLGEEPETEIQAEGQQINPAYWLQDKSFAGNLNFSATVSGTGFTPETDPWNYRFDFSEGEVGGQPFLSASLAGSLTLNEISNTSFLQVGNSRVELIAKIAQLREIPEFSYDLRLEEFNIAEINGLEDFPTFLNGRVEGTGQGNALENLYLQSTISMDSSSVNNEPLEHLSASLQVADTTAIISNAELQSAIANASFEGRLHLTDLYRSTNRLDFETSLKNIQSLAPLADAEQMEASGFISGELSPYDQNSLEFDGDVELADIMYDSLFTASNAKGNLSVLVQDYPEYSLDIALENPGYESITLQNFDLQTEGKVDSSHTSGDMSLQFTNSEEGRIQHAGNYYVSADSTSLLTDRLDFESSLRTLSLQRPFTFSYANEVARMDTMHLQSDDDAALLMAIPYADSTNQEAYLKGEKLNLNILQDILLSESYVGGMLSAELAFERADTALTASGALTLQELTYQDLAIDALNMEGNITEEVLDGRMYIRDQGREVMRGSASLPFKLGDPSEFDDAFFERSVRGELRVDTLALDQYETVISEWGLANTSGKINFDGDLGGQAGSPEFSGQFSLTEAFLSGVAVDSLTASVNYGHDSEQLEFSTAIHSLRQKAADITAQVPFHVDFRTFEVSLPEEDDRINAEIETNDFNLEALNDFVDRQQLRDIRGRLNGNLNIGGQISALESNGELMLDDGEVRIIPAGIRLQNMRSRVGFEPEQVRIREFRIESGNGNANLSGTIGLDELVPDDLDLSLSANNFRLANTADYNASVNSRMQLGGSVTSPDITGRLNFQNGFLRLNNFGERTVENVELEDEESVVENTALYDSLSMDMDVNFSRRFFIRNTQYLEMEVELDGQVDLVKEKQQDLQMFGSLNAASGYAMPLGKQFDIEEGTITFSGNPANPQVNVRSLYEPRQQEEEIEIWYIISGTVEDPQFSYESTPEMELQNIISYTLFGQPFYNLDSWQQVVTGSGSNATAADVAVDVLLDRVEALATRRLGIDVVRIDNTSTGGENATSVTTGWYVNPRVFFAVQNIITGTTPDTGFLLEYMLNRNLKLIISQGNDNRQGVDLKWNYDY